MYPKWTPTARINTCLPVVNLIPLTRLTRTQCLVLVNDWAFTAVEFQATPGSNKSHCSTATKDAAGGLKSGHFHVAGFFPLVSLKEWTLCTLAIADQWISKFSTEIHSGNPAVDKATPAVRLPEIAGDLPYIAFDVVAWVASNKFPNSPLFVLSPQLDPIHPKAQHQHNNPSNHHHLHLTTLSKNRPLRMLGPLSRRGTSGARSPRAPHLRPRSPAPQCLDSTSWWPRWRLSSAAYNSPPAASVNADPAIGRWDAWAKPLRLRSHCHLWGRYTMIHGQCW